MKTLKVFSIMSLWVVLFVHNNLQAAVWKTENQWNAEAEEEFAEWVEDDWTLDILTNPKSPYSKLKVDCADAVYTMRILYAFENALPFAMKDPTGGSNLISNEMSRFDHLAKYDRLKAFLKYVYDMGSTATLEYDTYSIPLNKKSVRSGALILEREKRHTYTIKKIEDSGQPLLYFSSLGNPGSMLVRKSWPQVDWIFPSGMTSPNGLRWFRQPADLKKPEWKITGYSDEQFKISKSVWLQTLIDRLKSEDESAEDRQTRLFDDLCAAAQFRITVVSEAIARVQSEGGSCLDAYWYDILSTPSRDRRLSDEFNILKKEFEAAKNKDDDSYELMAAVFLKNDKESDLLKACPIEYRLNKPISLSTLLVRMNKNLLSTNPNDSIEYRWGEKSGPSDRSKKCPKY